MDASGALAFTGGIGLFKSAKGKRRRFLAVVAKVQRCVA
jgi:hypothetical protein